MTRLEANERIDYARRAVESAVKMSSDCDEELSAKISGDRSIGDDRDNRNR